MENHLEDILKISSAEKDTELTTPTEINETQETNEEPPLDCKGRPLETVRMDPEELQIKTSVITVGNIIL